MNGNPHKLSKKAKANFPTSTLTLATALILRKDNRRTALHQEGFL